MQKYHAARKVSVPEADISARSYNKTEIMTPREILTRKLNSSKKRLHLLFFVILFLNCNAFYIGIISHFKTVIKLYYIHTGY